MNKTFYELRLSARESLSGNWAGAIGAYLLVGLILNSVSFIGLAIFYAGNMQAIASMARSLDYESWESFGLILLGTLGSTFLFMALSAVIKLLLTGAFNYGISAFYLSLSKRNEPKIETVFEGFKKFGSCFLANFLIGVFTFLWALLYAVVLFAILFGLSIISAISDSNLISIFVSIIYFIISLGSSIFMSVIIARYAMTYFLIKDCEKTDTMNYIKQSTELMRGNCWRYVILSITFIGWYILSFFTCGLGFLFLNPYIGVTNAHFYNDLVSNAKKSGKLNYVTLLEDAPATDEPPKRLQ